MVNAIFYNVNFGMQGTLEEGVKRIEDEEKKQGERSASLSPVDSREALCLRRKRLDLAEKDSSCPSRSRIPCLLVFVAFSFPLFIIYH